MLLLAGAVPSIQSVVALVLVTPLFILALAVHMAMDYSFVLCPWATQNCNDLGKNRPTNTRIVLVELTDCGSRFDLELFGKWTGGLLAPCQPLPTLSI